MDTIYFTCVLDKMSMLSEEDRKNCLDIYCDIKDDEGCDKINIYFLAEQILKMLGSDARPRFEPAKGYPEEWEFFNRKYKEKEWDLISLDVIRKRCLSSQKSHPKITKRNTNASSYEFSDNN